ncbi:unnamed protein product [Closterium sp. Yama58-4]|nr:unnamed protein product [Closterium sp. Yama58-4]
MRLLCCSRTASHQSLVNTQKTPDRIVQAESQFRSGIESAERVPLTVSYVRHDGVSPHHLIQLNSLSPPRRLSLPVPPLPCARHQLCQLYLPSLRHSAEGGCLAWLQSLRELFNRKPTLPYSLPGINWAKIQRELKNFTTILTDLRKDIDINSKLEYTRL